MSTLTIPNTFTSGTTIDPAAVNANFAAIAAFLNGANIGTGQLVGGTSAAPTAHASTHAGGSSDDIGATFFQVGTGAVPAGRLIRRAYGRANIATSSVTYGGATFVSKPGVGRIVLTYTGYAAADQLVISALADVGALEGFPMSAERQAPGIEFRAMTNGGALQDLEFWFTVDEVTT